MSSEETFGGEGGPAISRRREKGRCDRWGRELSSKNRTEECRRGEGKRCISREKERHAMKRRLSKGGKRGRRYVAEKTPFLGGEGAHDPTSS